MKCLLAFVLIAVSAFALQTAQQAKRLSREQAELLARTAADAQGLTKLRGFALEPAQMKEFPDFYFFDALVAEPGAQGFSGHYAVSKLTGDVWDPFKCGRISSGALSELQRKIRSDLGLTAAEYRRHARNKPCLV